MIAEHPAQAHWKPHAVNAWALPETRALLRHPDEQATALDQRMYGADARKATTLLTVHLPELAQRVRELPGQGRCRHLGGHQTALGRIQGTSEFRAAHLKEYPTGLRRLIAGSVIDHWADTLARQPRTSLPDIWATSCRTDMRQAMGADCAKKTVRLRPNIGTARQADQPTRPVL